MNHNFRQDAKLSLDRAKKELESSDLGRLRYAALELRMSMEALTYDRAQAFIDEIPPAEYGTWQPKKVMKLLIEIEPHADDSSTIRFGRQETQGQPAKEMRTLGSEKVFSLAALKKHYDALGSFLHMPTIKQLNAGDADLEKLKSRCEQIVAALDLALASRIFNSTLGNFSEMACVECNKPVRKRFPIGHETVDATCFECGAGYHLTGKADNTVEWKPKQQEVKCPTDSCPHIFAIWEHEIKLGAHWTCPKCLHHHRLGYAIFSDSETVD